MHCAADMRPGERNVNTKQRTRRQMVWFITHTRTTRLDTTPLKAKRVFPPTTFLTSVYGPSACVFVRPSASLPCMCVTAYFRTLAHNIEKAVVGRCSPNGNQNMLENQLDIQYLHGVLYLHIILCSSIVMQEL